MAAILSCGAMLNQRPLRRGCLIEFLYPTVEPRHDDVPGALGVHLKVEPARRSAARPRHQRLHDGVWPSQKPDSLVLVHLAWPPEPGSVTDLSLGPCNSPAPTAHRPPARPWRT